MLLFSVLDEADHPLAF